MVVGAKSLRHRSRPRAFIEVLVCKRHTECADGLCGHFRHQANNGARINASGQERTVRHVRPHAKRHRVGQQFSNSSAPSKWIEAGFSKRLVGRVPPRFETHVCILNNQQATRLQQMNVLDNGFRRMHSAVHPLVRYGGSIQPARHFARGQQCADL